MLLKGGCFPDAGAVAQGHSTCRSTGGAPADCYRSLCPLTLSAAAINAEQAEGTRQHPDFKGEVEEDRKVMLHALQYAHSAFIAPCRKQRQDDKVRSDSEGQSTPADIL